MWKIELKTVIEIFVVILLMSVLMPASNAADPEEQYISEIMLTMKFDPPAPKPLENQLHSVISATLMDVLITRKPGNIDAIRKHIDEISVALREGLNVVLEPKGFVVTDVKLEVGMTTKVMVSIIPAGGPPGQPGPVCEGAELILSLDDIPDFWHPALERELDAMRDNASREYSAYLVGVPLAATDKGFINDALDPYLSSVEPLQPGFNDFSVATRWELDTISRVYITLTPSGETVNRLRVRMSGDTIPNLALDELRDSISSRSDIVVGMPVNLVQSNLDLIGDYFANLVEADSLAQIFEARAKVEFLYREEDASLIALCDVRSELYDLNLRGYIDFGNEDVDSGEVEARLGYFFMKDIEVMFVLNLYTNDMTLEPDALLGWRPIEGTFLAAGWDIDAGAQKFFFDQRLTHNLYFEGEIFAESDRNQMGVYYRFHQYFSGGVYATGDSDYWFRTTFRL